MTKTIDIPCNDGTGNKLRLILGVDSDIWAMVIDENGRGLQKSVRVCTSAGGGRHRETRNALHKVIEAAEKEGLGV